MSARFVPVAANLYLIRRDRGAGGELFRSIQQQKDQFQGIWIVSPEGKVLGGYGDSRHTVLTNGDVDNARTQAAWVKVVSETIDTSLRAFGDVPPRAVQAGNPLPDRGLGIRLDGSARLALHARYIAYQPLRSDSDNHVRIDSLSLTAGELAQLAPQAVQVGAEWKVPEALVRQFSRALCPSSDSDGWPLPAEVRRAEITGRVEAIVQGVARLTYRGAISGVHVAVGQNASGLAPGQPRPTYGGEATVTGVALYDTTRRAMRALHFVFEGTYRYRMPADPRPMAAVVEWRDVSAAP